MKVTKIYAHGFSWVIIIMLIFPPGIMAQDSDQTAQPAKFTREELTQMIAPIALYPDSLLADILMASTYPIEVVEAERWLRQNGNPKGNELDAALQEKTWDSSVKSLCHFPDVLYSMSDKLDQTTKLGDAFLSQKDDVMDVVQELRSKAEEQGNLKTTEQQKVIVEKNVIEIVPANPEVIYVPVYDPLYAYGPWWYPSYPPYYWYYPPGIIVSGGFISFGFGIFLGFGIYSWCWFDWHHHNIGIDLHRTDRFNRFDRGRWDFNRHTWSHETFHRRGAAYIDRATSQRFGQASSRISRISPEARGYVGRSFGGQTKGLSGGTIERRGVSGTTGTSGVRIERQQIQKPTVRSNAFSGVGNGNFERKASERGFTSRQSTTFRSTGSFRSSGQSGSSFSGSGRSGGSFSGGSSRGGGFRR
jgi:hypothetical protein